MGRDKSLVRKDLWKNWLIFTLIVVIAISSYFVFYDEGLLKSSTGKVTYQPGDPSDIYNDNDNDNDADADGDGIPNDLDPDDDNDGIDDSEDTDDNGDEGDEADDDTNWWDIIFGDDDENNNVNEDSGGDEVEDDNSDNDYTLVEDPEEPDNTDLDGDGIDNGNDNDDDNDGISDDEDDLHDDGDGVEDDDDNSDSDEDGIDNSEDTDDDNDGVDDSEDTDDDNDGISDDEEIDEVIDSEECEDGQSPNFDGECVDNSWVDDVIDFIQEVIDDFIEVVTGDDEEKGDENNEQEKDDEKDLPCEEIDADDDGVDSCKDCDDGDSENKRTLPDLDNDGDDVTTCAEDCDDSDGEIKGPIDTNGDSFSTCDEALSCYDGQNKLRCDLTRCNNIGTTETKYVNGEPTISSARCCNKKEIDPRTDNNNCGECGNICTDGKICKAEPMGSPSCIIDDCNPPPSQCSTSRSRIQEAGNSAKDIFMNRCIKVKSVIVGINTERVNDIHGVYTGNSRYCFYLNISF